MHGLFVAPFCGIAESMTLWIGRAVCGLLYYCMYSATGGLCISTIYQNYMQPVTELVTSALYILNNSKFVKCMFYSLNLLFLQVFQCKFPALVLCKFNLANAILVFIQRLTRMNITCAL